MGCEEVPLEWNEFEMAAACLAMWSQCDDSELRYNEREGTARTVQSIESEQGHTSGSGRQRRHGLTRSVMGRGATLGTSSMGMARAFPFYYEGIFSGRSFRCTSSTAHLIGDTKTHFLLF